MVVGRLNEVSHVGSARRAQSDPRKTRAYLRTVIDEARSHGLLADLHRLYTMGIERTSENVRGEEAK